MMCSARREMKNLKPGIPAGYYLEKGRLFAMHALAMITIVQVT